MIAYNQNFSIESIGGLFLTALGTGIGHILSRNSKKKLETMLEVYRVKNESERPNK